jgi:cohesin loading factor subunit SCC2
LIISCFNAVKNQLEKIIYPFVEASIGMGFEFSGNPVLRFVVQDNSSTASSHRKQLSELFQALSSVIPRINNLVNAETVAMSDAIIISAVYIAIGPFFVVEGEGESKGKKEKDNIVLKTFGKSAMRGLRLDALGLIRSVSLSPFSLYPLQSMHIDLIFLPWRRSSQIMRVNGHGLLRKF